MKFKHTINLLIDNFKTTYKLLFYRAVITVLASLAYYGIIVLFVKTLNNIVYYTNLKDTFSKLFADFLNGDFSGMPIYFPEIGENVKNLLKYFADAPSTFIPFIIAILVVYLVSQFLHALGNYTASALINDKMAMQSDAPFFITLIKNLGKASAYSAIYVPLSLVYDAICVVVLYFVLFKALSPLPFMALLFLAVLLMILLIALKLTLTVDFFPAIICGKMGVGRALGYSLSRKSGNTLGVYAFFSFSCVLIMSINVMAAMTTLGVGLLISVPFSYVYLLCFEFANYYVNNDIKFFTDKRTIVKPEHEKETSREDFLRGE
ncbi:MAG: hypothetical protein LUI60_06835 [Clostridia bacterium]|nr:hypothetical protein [Clostridia bacterium]